jgi:hypothetical protein
LEHQQLEKFLFVSIPFYPLLSFSIPTGASYAGFCGIIELISKATKEYFTDF